jgi:hypothetical protein
MFSQPDRARHMSHVTRHSSNVKRHTSQVTHYMSHVTRHPPHNIRHTSRITHHAHLASEDRCSSRNCRSTAAAACALALPPMQCSAKLSHARHTSHIVRHTSLVKHDTRAIRMQTPMHVASGMHTSRAASALLDAHIAFTCPRCGLQMIRAQAFGFKCWARRVNAAR